MWQKPDSQRNVTCIMNAMGDSLQNVVISLPGETRKIGFIEVHVGRTEQFQGLTYGTPCVISFIDPATGKERRKKSLVRFS